MFHSQQYVLEGEKERYVRATSHPIDFISIYLLSLLLLLNIYAFETMQTNFNLQNEMSARS